MGQQKNQVYWTPDKLHETENFEKIKGKSAELYNTTNKNKASLNIKIFEIP
jgi:hypothetical protein